MCEISMGTIEAEISYLPTYIWIVILSLGGPSEDSQHNHKDGGSDSHPFFGLKGNKSPRQKLNRRHIKFILIPTYLTSNMKQKGVMGGQTP